MIETAISLSTRGHFRILKSGYFNFLLTANQITQWKSQLLARASEAFEGSGPSAPPVDVKTLHAKIGALTLENDFLEGALNKAGLLSARK